MHAYCNYNNNNDTDTDNDDGGGGGGGTTWNSWNYRHVQVCRIKAMCDQNNIYDHTVFRS